MSEVKTGWNLVGAIILFLLCLLFTNKNFYDSALLFAIVSWTKIWGFSTVEDK